MSYSPSAPLLHRPHPQSYTSSPLVKAVNAGAIVIGTGSLAGAVVQLVRQQSILCWVLPAIPGVCLVAKGIFDSIVAYRANKAANIIDFRSTNSVNYRVLEPGQHQRDQVITNQPDTAPHQDVSSALEMQKQEIEAEILKLFDFIPEDLVDTIASFMPKTDQGIYEKLKIALAAMNQAAPNETRADDSGASFLTDGARTPNNRSRLLRSVGSLSKALSAHSQAASPPRQPEGKSAARQLAFDSPPP